jgi:hypothetical protein
VPLATRDEVRRLVGEGLSRAEVARLLGICKSTVTYHARRFGMDIDDRPARRYDWQVIRAYYDQGHSMEECRARFGFCKASWTAAVRRGEIAVRPRAIPIQRLLVVSRSRLNLKRRLIQEGLLKPACASCGLADWRGAPVALQLHHINGQRHDNRLENSSCSAPTVTARRTRGPGATVARCAEKVPAAPPRPTARWMRRLERPPPRATSLRARPARSTR